MSEQSLFFALDAAFKALRESQGFTYEESSTQNLPDEEHYQISRAVHQWHHMLMAWAEGGDPSAVSILHQPWLSVHFAAAIQIGFYLGVLMTQRPEQLDTILLDTVCSEFPDREGFRKTLDGLEAAHDAPEEPPTPFLD